MHRRGGSRDEVAFNAQPVCMDLHSASMGVRMVVSGRVGCYTVSRDAHGVIR